MSVASLATVLSTSALPASLATTTNRTMPSQARIAAEHGLQEAAANFKATHAIKPQDDSSQLLTSEILLFGGFIALSFLVLFLRRRRRDERSGHSDENDMTSPSKRSRVAGRLRSWLTTSVRLFLLPTARLLPHRAGMWLRSAVVEAKVDEDATKDSSSSSGESQHEPHSVEMADVRHINLKRTSESHMERLREHLGAPKLLGSQTHPPTVLSTSALVELRRQLPIRLSQCDWALLYATDQHGCSLRTLYSKLAGRSGTLLVVLDAQGHIFGAFVSDMWRADKTYFGNGETFLYTLHPTFARYDWTKANSHFVLAAHDCIAFGGGGKFGLWLDQCLEFGSSDTSATFGNECLAGSTQFKCIKVEVWGFV